MDVGQILTAPMPLLAPVMRMVFPSKRDALKTDMEVEKTAPTPMNHPDVHLDGQPFSPG